MRGARTSKAFGPCGAEIARGAFVPAIVAETKEQMSRFQRDLAQIRADAAESDTNCWLCAVRSRGGSSACWASVSTPPGTNRALMWYGRHT